LRLNNLHCSHATVYEIARILQTEMIYLQVIPDHAVFEKYFKDEAVVNGDMSDFALQSILFRRRMQ